MRVEHNSVAIVIDVEQIGIHRYASPVTLA